MAFYNNRSFALERGLRPNRSRPLGPVGHRLAGALRGGEDPGLRGRGASGDEPDTVAEQLPQRFPVVRHGYDQLAVEEYLTGLEQELAALDHELAQLRGGAAKQEVASELKRIGEQTSAVLVAAHEQEQAILRRAQAEADSRVTEATATANTLTSQCEQRLRELRSQITAAESERDRLLEDVRKVSAALTAVADSATAAT